jgi:hypothetical protein
MMTAELAVPDPRHLPLSVSELVSMLSPYKIKREQLYWWFRHGFRTKTGGVVRLRAQRVGKRFFTTLHDWEAFLAELNQTHVRLIPNQIGPAPAP